MRMNENLFSDIPLLTAGLHLGINIRARVQKSSSYSVFSLCLEKTLYILVPIVLALSTNLIHGDYLVLNPEKCFEEGGKEFVRHFVISGISLVLVLGATGYFVVKTIRFNKEPNKKPEKKIVTPSSHVKQDFAIYSTLFSLLLICRVVKISLNLLNYEKDRIGVIRLSERIIWDIQITFIPLIILNLRRFRLEPDNLEAVSTIIKENKSPSLPADLNSAVFNSKTSSV
ncbi:uncharacterized protein LOC111694941 [Eurytemora carolleeae]|uniref:uncharacterized protein LOC111694941 n=1 Tax=Eurytemora carolleeae TaxID=1294199 RepID=UPI000C76E891|nr:uncharacterized protein LOC111694941 [Eurytemora carolleeae]|eukprot:XP_023319789.1 uncharacterized protein LOC111694941 [Eurytemora affinis]